MKSSIRIAMCLALLAAAGMSVLPAGATNMIWNLGAGTVDNWTTTTRWTPNGVPNAGDQATVYNTDDGGVNSIVLNGDQTVGGVYYPSHNHFNVISNTAARLTVVTNLIFNARSYSASGGPWSHVYPMATIQGQVTVPDILVSPYFNSALNFANTANVFQAGMNLIGNRINVTNWYNTFSGPIKVRGWLGEWWTTDERVSGAVHIHGSNNTFNAGSFELLPGGQIWISQSSDLAALSGVTFSGGTLQLGRPGLNYSNNFAVVSFPNGWEVKAGTLHVSGNACMGPAAIGVKLGSTGYYGCLKGEANNAAGARIERPIQIAGNGGVLDSYYPNVAYPAAISRTYDFYIPAIISGSGDLIIRGHNQSGTWINNGAYAVYTPNTFAGDTRVPAASGLVVESLRSLGTGNLVIQGGGYVLNYTTNIVTAGKTITIKAAASGHLRPMGMLRIATTADMAYPISADSDGALLLSVSSSGMTAFNNALGAAPPGNGTMWLGGDGTLAATSLAPGAGGVYRIWGCPWNGNWLGAVSGWFNLDAAGTPKGVLTGTNRVEVGLPYNPYNPWGGLYLNAQTYLADTNDYSGPTIVHLNAMLVGTAAAAGGGSPFGSTNGEVYLKGGQLGVWANGGTAVQPIRKGRLTIQGGAVLRLNTGGGIADLTFDDLVRSNKGTLITYMQAGVLGSTSNRIKFAAAPGVTNGMVAPWIVSTDGFLTYDATAGLTNAVITHTVPAGAFPTGLNTGTEIVNVTGATTLGDNPSINGLQSGADIAPGVGNTITIASGGLHLKTANHTISANLVFSNAAGLAEAIIYRPSNGHYQQVNISGKITAAGLTKFSTGFLRLSNPNNDIRGPIVNSGGGYSAPITADSALCIGLTNDVILNGGGFTGNNQAYSNRFLVGPGGGGFIESVTFYGPVQDLVPGDAGPFRPYNGAFYGTNTFSGGVVLDGAEFRFMKPWACPTNCPIVIRNGTALFQNSAVPAGAVYTNYARISLLGNRALFMMIGYIKQGSIDGSGFVLYGNRWDGGDQAVFDVGWDNTDFDFYGAIMECQHGWRGHVVKNGAGTWTYWGDSTHHGYTRITNGTLTLNGALFNTTNVTVYAGATLNGKGAVGGPVTVLGTGKIGGSLVFETNVTLNSSATVDVALNGTNAVSQFSQLTLKNGTLNVAGCALNLTLGFTPAVGQSLTIVNNTGGTITGTPFAQGNVVSATYSGKTVFFRVTYAPGGITLTALPQGTVIYVR